MTKHQASELTRPIIGIENRTAQEVFDIMCDRFTRATQPQSLTIDDETVARLREALEDAESLLALVEHPAIPDPEWAPLVQGLGERIGYGNLMTTASALWRDAGIVPGGEFVAGPCMGSVRATLAKVRAALAAPKHGEVG